MNESSRTIALFAAFVVGALLVRVAERASIAREQSTTVIASQTRWDIDPRGVSCLSLNRKILNRIFGKDYSDDPRILTLLQLVFPNARVSANDPKCQYVLTFNVNTDYLSAARLLARRFRKIHGRYDSAALQSVWHHTGSSSSHFSPAS
jgi:hypothetical protein